MYTPYWTAMNRLHNNKDLRAASPKNGLTDNKVSGDFWGFIRSNQSDAAIQCMIAFSALKHRDEISFVDAGCGLGNILALARGVHEVMRVTGAVPVSQRLNMFGFEIQPDLAESAAGLGIADIFVGDIRKVNYSAFDIVHYYQPIRERKQQSEFELLVEKQLKKGAIIIPRLKVHEGIKKSRLWKPVKMPEEVTSKHPEDFFGSWRDIGAWMKAR